MHKSTVEGKGLSSFILQGSPSTQTTGLKVG